MATKPTIGQIERELTQRLQSLYHDQSGHRPSKVVCQFFDHRIAVTVENAVTPAEQTLINDGKEEIATQFRLGFDKTIEPQLKALVEEIVGTSVLDIMSDTTLETGRTGIILVLEESPDVRNPEAIPKAK
ncbi:MAG: DUF2294 domain-containing protein [Nostocaceae cyanobacterium]|nr:DUF2294 domain-containing protein [Nostocaceae cyanobacterium]